jgi:uncharacterized membrane protein
MQTEDIDYEEQALKERNRALIALLIGLILIPIAVFLVYRPFGWAASASDMEAIGTFVMSWVMAMIVGLASVICLLAALLFLVRLLVLRRYIKSMRYIKNTPNHREPEGSTTEPRNVSRG